MLAILGKKRNGAELTGEEIEYLVHRYMRGEIPNHQAAAWLMAAHVRGLSRAKTAHLTDAMMRSGEQLVALAAGGLAVPMNSGPVRSHTGGSLDKLEAIPGFRVNLPTAEFRRVLKACGCAMIGETAEIAPAGQKL